MDVAPLVLFDECSSGAEFGSSKEGLWVFLVFNLFLIDFRFETVNKSNLIGWVPFSIWCLKSICFLLLQRTFVQSLCHQLRHHKWLASILFIFCLFLVASFPERPGDHLLLESVKLRLLLDLLQFILLLLSSLLLSPSQAQIVNGFIQCFVSIVWRMSCCLVQLVVPAVGFGCCIYYVHCFLQLLGIFVSSRHMLGLLHELRQSLT